MVISAIKSLVDGMQPLVRSKDGTKTLFSVKELRCKWTHKYRFADGFLDALRDLRESMGESMTVNSCCRSKDYNIKVGGNPHSFHVYDMPYYPTGGTCAIDIARRGSEYDDKLIKLALSQGWFVGLSNSFIHMDRRIDHVARFKNRAIKGRIFTYDGYIGRTDYA